jgi:Cell division control protein 14, SIN component
VSTLLGQPGNTRTFESLDGLLIITTLFKSRSTAREVKMKLVEFLYFYLMPETPQPQLQVSASASNTAVLGGRGRELVAAFERNRLETIGGVDKAGGDLSKTKSTEEKQKMLGKYLGNVDDLVEDLRESGGPFSGGAF